MEGKKRYIAIILFLLICLMVFTFATTGDEELEQGTGNGSNIQEVTDKETSDKDKEETKSEDKEDSKESNSSNKPNSNSSTKEESSSNAEDEDEDLDGTGEVDNSAYDKALEAVEELEKLLTDAQAEIARDLVEEVTNSDQFKELMERVEDAEDAIDATELVEKLETMVKEAAEKADITDAIDFRDEEVTDAVNEIDGENLEDVKEDLLDRIAELSKILDDNNDPTIDGIKDGAYTNLDEVKLTITDENEVEVKVTKDGKEIDYTETFTEEGTYEVTVVDAAFNDVTKTFTIDRTKPQFEGLTSGNHYDIIKLDVKDASPVKITISKDHAKATDIENGSELTEDGTYRIVATDEAGNSKEIWVAIDSTLPTIEPDVEYTNVKGQKVTIADKFLMTVTINGKEYTRSDFNKGNNNEYFTMEYTLEEDGEYTIVAKDKKGLSVEKTIILDTIKPKFEGLASNEVDTDYYKVDVTDATPVKIYVSKNFKAFEEIEEGYELTEEATYQLKAVDAAGNTKINWVHIDKTKPTITVTPDGEYINVCPTIEVFDRYLDKVTIDGKVYDRKSFTKNNSNENFKLNVTLEDCVDGLHTVTAVDKRGLSVTKEFTVDRKAPTYKFYKEGSSLDKDEIQPKIIKGKLYFDQNVRVVFKEETTYFTQYIHNDFVNNEKETTIKRWQREALTDGEHTMKVTDALGHVTEVTFTIDTKAPTYKFYKEGSSLDKDEIQPKIINGKLYFDQNVRVVFEEEASYFTQYIHNNFVNNEKETTIKRWQREALTDGEHTMKVTDALGYVTEVTFTIDTKKPTYKFYKEGSSLDKDEIQPKIVDGKLYFDQNVRVVFKEETTYFTQYIHNDFVNNEKETTIKRWQREALTDGEHTMKVTDALGHVTEVTFIVDTTPIAVTSANMYTNGKVYGTTYYATKGQTITAYVRLYEKSETLPIITLDINGTKVVLDNVKESIHKPEDKEEGIIKYEGTYTIPEDMKMDETEVTYTVTNITDKAGNTTTVTKVTNKNIIKVDTTIPKITTINIRGGKSTGKGANTTYYAKKGAIIYLNVFFKEELPVKPVFVLNGTKVVPAGGPKYDAKSKTYNYSASWKLTDELEEGLIKVEVKDFSDKAGNTITYKLEEHKLDSQSRVIVDNTTPELTPSYTEKTIEINSVEEFTEYPTFEVADNYKKDIEAKLVSGKVDPTKVGVYPLVYRATDNAGNFTEVTITVNVVDTTAPEVEASYTETTVSEDSEEEFTGFPTFKVTDNSKGEVKEELISGKVDIHKLGVYKLVYRFTDESGNYTDKTIIVKVVDTTAPTITGIEDGAYYNTKTTHAIPVASDKHGAVLMVKTTLGDVELKTILLKETEMKLVGTYTVYAVDIFGNKSKEYTVHIDPYAPKILVLDRIENISGAYLPIKPVILEHNIDTIEVTLDGKKIDYKVGDQLTKDGKYVMTVTDKAANSTTVEFTMDSIAPTMMVSPTSLGVVDSLDLNDSDNITGLIINEEAEFQLMKANKNVSILDYNIPIYEYVETPENGIIDEEGQYIIIAYDKAYNITAYKFIVDRSAPTVNVEEGKFYSSVTINVEDPNMATGSLEDIKDLIPGLGSLIPSLDKLIPSITIKEENDWISKTIENGYVVDEDGTYTLVAKDAIGVNPLFSEEEQAAHTTTVTFHIDTKKPTANVVEGGVYKSVTVSVDDAHLDEESITINGKKYDGKEITEEGNYVLEAKDLAGNTLTVNFEVDKTPITISRIDKNLYKKDDVVTIEVEARDTDAVIKLNGNTITSGHKVSEQGNYLVVVTDKWGNTVEKSFTIDTSAPVIQNPFNGTEITIGKNPNGLDIVADVKDDFGEYPKTVQPEVTTIGSDGEPVKLSKLDTKIPGKYELRYNVKDTAGNAAQELVVTINVMDVEYTLSFKDGNQITYTYDGAEKLLSSFAVQLYSNIDGDYVILEDGDINVELLNGSKIKDVGIYTVKATVNDTNKYPNATSAELTVTIKAKEVVAAFESNLEGLSSIEQYEFNGKTNPFKVTLTGVVEGETVSTTIDYGTETFAPGKYTAEALLEDDDFEHNYIITNQYHSYEITKASATVSLPTTILGEVKVTNSNGFDITSKATINRSDELVAWDTQTFNKTKNGECLEYGTIFGSQYCKKYEKIPYTETWRVDVTYQTIQVVSNEYMNVPDKQEEMMGESLLDAVKIALQLANITILDDVTEQLKDSVPTTGTSRAYISKLPSYYEVTE